MNYKIEFNKNACIGCGSCTSVCANWEMKGTKACPKKTMLNDVGCNKEAAEICPANAITIKDMK
ncbi:MAG: 4Fe-4S binding protein [Candidatus Aenigmatarchaeota archaeon]